MALEKFALKYTERDQKNLIESLPQKAFSVNRIKNNVAFWRLSSLAMINIC